MSRNLAEHIALELKESGLSEDEISRYSAEKLFIEYCNWNGLIGWGSELISALDELRDFKKTSANTPQR